MNLAIVDKLAKDKKGVKSLLVFFQGLFDRTIDAKGIRRKDSKETVQLILKKIIKTK